MKNHSICTITRKILSLNCGWCISTILPASCRTCRFRMVSLAAKPSICAVANQKALPLAGSSIPSESPLSWISAGACTFAEMLCGTKDGWTVVIHVTSRQRIVSFTRWTRLHLPRVGRYTFNRIDRRLQRLQEVATFIFESFAGFEDWHPRRFFTARKSCFELEVYKLK